LRRLKETDRVAALATELRKLGQQVEERPDGLTITPRPVTPADIDTYDDHRMAMSFGVATCARPEFGSSILVVRPKHSRFLPAAKPHWPPDSAVSGYN